MGTRNALWRTVLLLVLLLVGCSSSARAVSSTQSTIPGTEVRRVHSEVVGQDYALYIALPFGYGIVGQAYPVVYVLSGDDHFGLTADTARLLRAGNEAPDLIVVGIGYGPEWNVRDLEKNVKRYVNDLTPTSITTYAELGGSSKFLQFIREELVPFVMLIIKRIPRIAPSWGTLSVDYSPFTPCSTLPTPSIVISLSSIIVVGRWCDV